LGSYLNYEQNVLFLMFLKYSNSSFMFIIFIRTIMVISSSSWLTAWLSLEINIISIIPILINKQRFDSTSSAIKYFLIQAIASIFLIIIVLVIYRSGIINLLNINNEIALIGLAIKSGIPPFHFWLPQVIESINIVQMFITMSWQKIAPFSLMRYSLSTVIILIILARAVVGALGGFNQNSLKKILVYSSITHGAWIMSAIILKSGLWIVYFTIYNIRLYIMCLIMNKLNVGYISEMNNSLTEASNKLVFMTNLISMSGLPPFLGFAAKFLVLKTSMIYYIVPLIIFLLIMSFLSVFYYLKICFSSFLMNEKQIFKVKKSMGHSYIIVLTAIRNISIPIMVYIA